MRFQARTGHEGSKNECDGAGGFTLLEMLIAIGISALVVTVAVQAHIAIENAQERTAHGMDRTRTAQILLSRIERELVGSVLVKRSDEEERLSHPWVFVGRDDATGGMDADALRFVTLSPARAGVSIPATGIALVTYASSSDDEDGLQLRRDEQALVGGLDTQIDTRAGQLVADRLASFQIRYGDTAGGQRDDWNSTDLAMLDRLPTSVELTVALLEEGPDGEWVEGPEHSRSIDLLVREIDLEELRAAASAAGEGETCMTVEQCVEAFSSYLPPSGQLRERILEALSASSGECFQLDTELADDLADLGGPDPSDTCGR